MVRPQYSVLVLVCSSRIVVCSHLVVFHVLMELSDDPDSEIQFVSFKSCDKLACLCVPDFD
jgi:hypothetical protein